MRLLFSLTQVLLLSLLTASVFAQNYVVWQGGVGEEERTQAPATGTRLVFFASTGAFLADISVTVTKNDGTQIVNTTVNGPWLILNLPDGAYRVKATRNNGDAQSVNIQVKSSQQQEFALRFPEAL